MKKSVTYLVLLFLFTSTGCKKEHECPVKPEPHEAYIYEFQLVDMIQNPKVGYCGPVIQAYLDSSKTELIFFKAVDLPSGISFSLTAYYKGRFEILPETYKCIDGRPDPIPNAPPHYIYTHFVNILEWEKK